MKRLLTLSAVACLTMQAAVTLPALISDHMLLQRDAPVRIWGKANPGENVTVRFANQTVSATATADGRWEVWLKPMAAGTSGAMRVEGDNEAGLAHRLTQQWALASISFQGLTMSVLGDKFVGYAAFDTTTDANRAAAILGDLGASGGG